MQKHGLLERRTALNPESAMCPHMALSTLRRCSPEDPHVAAPWALGSCQPLGLGLDRRPQPQGVIRLSHPFRHDRQAGPGRLLRAQTIDLKRSQLSSNFAMTLRLSRRAAGEKPASLFLTQRPQNLWTLSRRYASCPTPSMLRPRKPSSRAAKAIRESRSTEVPEKLSMRVLGGSAGPGPRTVALGSTTGREAVGNGY